jgi:uncharacterized membrane protein
MAQIDKLWWVGILRWLGRTLAAGLGAVLPLIVVLYLIGWLLITAEAMVAGAIGVFLPQGPDGAPLYYIPGMGLVLALIVLLLIGVSLRSYTMRRAIVWEDRLLRRIPLVRTLYTSVKDIGEYFRTDNQKEMGQSVLVKLPGTQMQLLGFMTQTDGHTLAGCELVDDPVMVYLPMSYQIGGYFVVVPRTAVQPLDLPFDETMSFIFMAGMRDLNGQTSCQQAADDDAQPTADPTQTKNTEGR